MPLTDLSIRKARPHAKPYKLADGGGMYLLVNTNGAKYWRLKYRVAGIEKLLAIGTYPELSLVEHNGVEPLTSSMPWKRSTS